MKDKIQKNFDNGKYTDMIIMPSALAYKSEDRTDYLLSEQIIFSHRINEITPESFPEDLHSHDFYELIICADGENMQYISDSKYLSVRSGTVILTKPMAMHIYRPLVPLCYNRYVIYFKQSVNIFADKHIFDFLQSGNESVATFYFPDSETICRHLRKAEQELSDTSSPYSATKALLSICNLFVALSDNTKHTDLNTAHIPDYLYKIKEYIDREFINISNISDLADKFYYSREYITRGFSKYFNTSLYEYILRRKILHCCSLLKQGMSVEKSAVLSGFNNISGFTRVFKKFMGCTPTEYKKEM